MLDKANDFSDVQENVLAATIFGGAIGILLVLVVLVCVCWLRKSSSTRINEQSDGYQDIRESGPAQRVQFRRPFKKERKSLSNGNANNSQGNSLPLTAVSSAPHPRFYQFPAAPLPILPASSTPSTSIVGVGRGTLTRESSTSELYASVDRNPVVDEIGRRRQSSESREDVGNENGEEHTYSKIRPPPGTYDEIDEIAAAATTSKIRPPAPARPPLINKNEDIDPFYSRLNNVKSKTNAPPPVPRLPSNRTAHPYDYPRFLNNNGGGGDRWHSIDSADSTRPSIPRKVVNDPERLAVGGASTPSANGDAVYSKIESQYGGSEDPYSSIRSSEEHYSCVLPTRVSNGSSGDENNANTKGLTVATSSGLPGRTVTAPAYGSIRPRSVRHVRPRRSRSDGEEYSIIRKPTPQNYKFGQNVVVAPGEHRAPPPIPEKRYSAAPYSNDWQNPPSRDPEAPSTSFNADYGSSGVVLNNSRLSLFPSNFDRQDAQSGQIASGDNTSSGAGASKREPSYRFITVRESLDALRARMEAAAAANVAASAAMAQTPIGAAHSDSSLHYYATISEHSYEVVPSRRGSERNARRDETGLACRTVSYIDDDDDDDEYEPGTEEPISPLGALDKSPNSTKVDSDTSSNTLMNVSAHSHAGSHAASAGSHVTLVHVGGLQNASTSREPDNDPLKVHLRRSPRQQRNPLDQERRKARVCRMASSDDSTSSTGAALSIDIESGFGVDEHLSTVDQRDFDPSASGDLDARSGFSLDIVDDGAKSKQFSNSARTADRINRGGSSNLELPRSNSARSPNGRSPEIVKLEKLENFNVSSSNSLDDDGEIGTAAIRDSSSVSYQL